MFKCELHDIYCEMHEYFPFYLNFRVSGKFPEIAGQATRSRQATHHWYAKNWVLKEELPGGRVPAARRRKVATHFWVFLDKLPGSDEHLPGDVSCLGSIFGFFEF